jgi:acetylornithine deacetylase/succinyl-diaminopimelate desuccinylase-like protein
MTTELRDLIEKEWPRTRDELAELVAFRSVADPRQFPPQECERAARWVLTKFAEVGFQDAHLERTADGSMAVVGSRPSPDPASPTVLLYAHYDVRPPLDESAWRTPPFELTEADGRWYGRGSADCKGNIVMLLAALRALGEVPVHLKLVVEGSEEQGTGGLEAFVPEHADLLRADAVLMCDTGNAAVGHPAATVSLRGIVNAVLTLQALGSEVHSGMFGGPAPDALAALVAVLATLRDERGNTTIAGLDNGGTWLGEGYPPDLFRWDATVLEGVSLLGDGSVADMLWARPALTILGIDCPPVVGSASAVTPRASARLNLRVPPGTTAHKARKALESHLRAAAPWGVAVQVTLEAEGEPFRASVDGPAFQALAAGLEEAYGRPMTKLGQGGSIRLCNVFADTYPAAEIILVGVEEPLTAIHAPNESVDPGEIANMALGTARFLQRYGGAPRTRTAPA